MIRVRERALELTAVRHPAALDSARGVAPAAGTHEPSRGTKWAGPRTAARRGGSEAARSRAYADAATGPENR
jgi:hypothetical protein